jgi:hypothetical protein
MKKIVMLLALLLCASMVIAQPGPVFSHETIASGNWSSESVWADGQVPLMGGTATVGIHHNVVLDTYAYVQSVNVLSGGNLSCSSENRLSIADNGSLGCYTGTSITFTSGTVSFGGSASVEGGGGTPAITLYDADVSLGTINLSGATINGTLTIQGGTVSNPPVYGSSSVLKYFVGEAYSVGGEWVANVTSGAGVPANVLALTTANIVGGGTRHVRGNLTAQSNGVFNLNNILTIEGNVSLGNSTVGYGTINSNFTLVKFVGSGDQSIEAKNGLTLYDFTVEKPGGRVLLTQSGNSVTITGVMTLISGIVEVSTVASLMIDDGGSISGDGDAFVDGSLTIKKSGGGMAWFPVGDGSAYRPMRATVNGSNCVMVGRVVNQGYSVSGDGIDHVSADRHWEFGYISGTFNDATIELNYGADDGVSDAGNLRVAKLDVMGGGATNLGGMGNGTSSGFIVSNSFVPGVWDFLALGNATGGTNALPVTLVSFKGIYANAQASLQWSTASEVNNYGFDIERRAGTAGAWTKIGFVEGNGTTVAPHDYSFTDASASSGKNNYRLNQIDLDGAKHYSEVIVVDVPAGVTGVASLETVPLTTTLAQNYPNPFNPSTMIEFTVAKTGAAKLTVYDLLGREVAVLADGEFISGMRHRVQFDASRLTSGMYFYRLMAGDATAVHSLIVAK